MIKDFIKAITLKEFIKDSINTLLTKLFVQRDFTQEERTIIFYESKPCS